MDIVSDYRAAAGLHTHTHTGICVCSFYLGHILGLIHASIGEESREVQAYLSLYNAGTQRADDSFSSFATNDNRAERALMCYWCITLL